MSIRPEITDCVVLFCVNVFSTLSYLFRLGFYSDDWAYQGVLAHSSARGIGAMLKELLKVDQGLLIRPVQIAYLVLGFKAFGRHATPYHLVNSVVLGLVTVFLYLVLTELRTGRWLAFVVAVVFGLLPHYSTDRFWIASQQATLSMAFAFLGIYALLRSVRPKEESSRKWAVLAVLALALSILSYEVALGLIVVTLGMIGLVRYIGTHAPSRSAFRSLGGVIGASVVLLLIGIIKIRMQERITFNSHHFLAFLPRLGGLVWHAAVQAVEFNLWTYGVRMPAVLISLYRHSALSLAAVCSASIIALLVAVYLWRCMGRFTIPDRRACLRLVAIGFLLFALGYGLFFPYADTDFSSTGVDNRVAIASALGVPCVLAGILGLAFSILKSQVARSRACAVAIGLICGANCLVVNGLSFFWVEAGSQQSAILRTIASSVRSLPSGSVLLLDGFCRYIGPGIVFETDWDSTGAIRLLLGDNSLTGDVVSPNLRLRDATVQTTIYGGEEGNYPYGNHLFVFNMQRKTLTSWPSKEVAIANLGATNPSQDSGCPAGKEGIGTKVF